MFKISCSLTHIRVSELKKTISSLEKEIDTRLFHEATAKMLNGMMQILSLGASLPGFVPHDDAPATIAIQRLYERLEAAKAELVLIEQKIERLPQATGSINHDAQDDLTLYVQLK